MIKAYNGLGAILRDERQDLLQRELLLSKRTAVASRWRTVTAADWP